MNPVTPNHALQRTPGFGVQLPGAGGRSTGSVTGFAAPHELGAGGRSVLWLTPAQARAFASRRGAAARGSRPGVAELGVVGHMRTYISDNTSTTN